MLRRLFTLRGLLSTIFVIVILYMLFKWTGIRIYSLRPRALMLMWLYGRFN